MASSKASSTASPSLRILLVFILIKLTHFLIIYITPAQFDLSSQLHIPYIHSSPVITEVLNKLRHWDAVYFARLFETGPKYEHEWVFSPFWWRLLHYIPDTYTSKFINAIIISNLLQLASAFILYHYTKLKFIDDSNQKIAIRTSVLFLVSTIGVFGTAPYSENLNTFMIFAGLYLIEISKTDIDKSTISSILTYILSTFLFQIAFWTRSNSILIGIVYLHDLFLTKFKKRALISGILLGLSAIYYNYLPYEHFCLSDNENIPTWCNNTIPSLFTYAQSKYWDNGLLTYWTLTNIPNFVIALPELILLFESGLYFNNFKNLKDLVIINFLFLAIVIFFLNVQIVLRISSFMPLQFWYLSSNIGNGSKIGKIYVIWMVTYGIFQCALFAAFLPPA